MVVMKNEWHVEKRTVRKIAYAQQGLDQMIAVACDFVLLVSCLCGFRLILSKVIIELLEENSRPMHQRLLQFIEDLLRVFNRTAVVPPFQIEVQVEGDE